MAGKPKKGPKTHEQICYENVRAMIGRANAYLDAVEKEEERPSFIFDKHSKPDDREWRAIVISEFIQFAAGLEVGVDSEGRNKRHPRVV